MKRILAKNKSFSIRRSVLALALSAGMACSAFANAPIDQVVAVVGNSAILQSELDQATNLMKQQLQTQKQALPPENIIRQRVLEQLILREAQLELVKRYNADVPAEDINKALLNYAKQQGVNSLEEFQKKLDKQQPGLYALYRQQMAEEIAMDALRQQLVMSRIKISDRDVTNFLQSPQGQAMLGTQIRVVSFKLTPKNPSVNATELKMAAQQLRTGLATTEISDATINQLNKKYSNNDVNVQGKDLGYASLSDLPADLAARISSLEVGQTTDAIPAQDGAYVLKLIDRKASDKKNMVTQYKTQHILIAPSEVVSLADAEQKIKQIYQRLQQNYDFGELAATYSNDPGSARDSGNLGWVASGMMVPEFETMMKETPVGQISKPFQTQYGWHILKVNEIRQADMTEEYQRRMARQLLGSSRYDAELEAWLRELRHNTYVDIKDPSLKN